LLPCHRRLTGLQPGPLCDPGPRDTAPILLT
jgi:hypothetical protein